MTILTTTEVVLVAALTLVCCVVGFTYLRRRVIASGGPLMVCALRSSTAPRWRLGLVRMSPEALQWYSVIGPSIRPEHSWRRHDLDLGAPRELTEQIPGLADPLLVGASARGADYELAMQRGACTAVRAWLESSPPGYNVNVA